MATKIKEGNEKWALTMKIANASRTDVTDLELESNNRIRDVVFAR